MKSRKFRIIESAVCTAVAMVILMIAASCGGSNPITSIIGGANSVVARLSTHNKAHTSLLPKTSKGNFIAMFQASGGPTPSQLPESFEATCDLTGNAPGTVTGNLVLEVPNGLSCGPSGIFFGGVGSFPVTGIPVALSGTITVMKVNVVTVNGQHVRCILTTGNSAVNDNDPVQPYYNMDTNTVVFGIGTTQLSDTCAVPVAAGDSPQKIIVDYSKT